MKIWLLAASLLATQTEVSDRSTRPTLRGLGSGTLVLLAIDEQVPLEFYTLECTSASEPVTFAVRRSGKEATPPIVTLGEVYTDVDRGVSLRIDPGDEPFASGDTFSFVTYREPKELGDLFDRWLKEYVKWIIAKEERERFQSLTAPTDKLGFIESFWLRRDMKPETPENEYRAEHGKRFVYAVQTFGAGIPGWATDMGKIYILLGPPSTIQRSPAGRTAFERPSEVWTYNNAPNPSLPASFDIGFVDFTATGRFEMVNASNMDIVAPIRTNIGYAMSELEALGLMRSGGTLMDQTTGLRSEIRPTQMSMDQFDFQRNLREVQKVPFINLPSLKEVTTIRADFPSLPLFTGATFFPLDDSKALVPITVSMPYARLTPQKFDEGYRYVADVLVRVTAVSGEEQPLIEDRLEVRVSADDLESYCSSELLYEAAVTLTPGTYEIEALIRDNPSGTLGSASNTIVIPELAGQELALSSLLLASGAVETMLPPSDGPRPPFQFGNLRIIPNVRRRFPRSLSMTAYFQAFRYGLDPEDKRARLKVDLFILKDGRLFSKVEPSYHRPTQSQVAIKSALNLRGLPGGNYVLRARVTDEISGQIAERDAEFTVDSRS